MEWEKSAVFMLFRNRNIYKLLFGLVKSYFNNLMMNYTCVALAVQTADSTENKKCCFVIQQLE